MFMRILLLYRLYGFQSGEVTRLERRVGELTGRVSELEDSLSKAQRDLARAQDTNAKLQRDLKENVAQKEDQVSEFLFSFKLYF